MSEYKPSYMQDEDEQQSTANPLQTQQNTLQAAPGSATSAVPAPTTNQNISTSAEGGNVGMSSGTQAGSAPAANASRRSSGQFTNLQKFMKANQSADLGGRIQGNIQKQVAQTQENLASKAAETGEALAEQKQQREQTFGNAQTALQQVGQTKEVTGQEKAPTSQEAGDYSTQEQQLTAARDFQYQGPKSFDIQDIEKNRAQLESQAKATGSSAGRFGLLQDMFGRDKYSVGQQKLDNLLLQSDKKSQDKLAEARMSARQLGQNVEQTKAKTGEEIRTEMSNAKAEVDSFAEQLGTTSETLTTNLGQRIEAINKDLAADFAEFSEEEKADILKKIGFGQNQKTGEFVIGDLTSVGVNELKDIFEQVKNEASIANLDKDALARANLLQRLRGQDELAQFDDTKAPFGVEKKLQDQFSDLAQFAPGQTVKGVQGAMASPQMIGEVKNLASSNAQKYTAAKLDNIIMDTKDQRVGLNRELNSADIPEITPPGFRSQPIKDFTNPKAQAIVQKHDMYKILSPKEQQQINALMQQGKDPVYAMSQMAINRAKEAKGFAVGQNKAQQTAVQNMAKYLRDTSGNMSSRDVFEKNWAPTMYDKTTDYRQGGGLYSGRAQDYYK